MSIQEEIIKILSDISNFVWGLPLIALLLGTGVYLTIILKGLQFRALIPSLYIALIKRKEERESEGDISHFQALMTALAATVGVGNIAGLQQQLRQVDPELCSGCGSPVFSGWLQSTPRLFLL